MASILRVLEPALTAKMCYNMVLAKRNIWPGVIGLHLLPELGPTGSLTYLEWRAGCYC